MKGIVGRLRLGSVVWLGMILAGACLGAFVFVAWPEPTTHLTRLPYGESRPKTPSVAVERKAPVKRVVASVGVVAPPQPELAPVRRPPSVSSRGRLPSRPRARADGYRPETAEELGAKPLPGMYPDAAATP